MSVKRGESVTKRKLVGRNAVKPFRLAPTIISPSAFGRGTNGIQRPHRWRGPKTAGSDSIPRRVPGDTGHNAPSKRSSYSAQDLEIESIIQPSKPEKVELRFSFTAIGERTSSTHDLKHLLNNSFSELLVANKDGVQAPRRGSETKPALCQSLLGYPTIPLLSKPKKKREGYGFSYSDTFFEESDEYPDTECDWGGIDQQKPQLSIEPSTSTKQRCEWTTEQQIAHHSHSFGSSASTVLDESFNDVVVVRDVGSFHLAKPQRSLSCTPATREDTIRLQIKARALFHSYRESVDVQSGLLRRLERMVQASQTQAPFGQANELIVSHCAVKLRNFLLRYKEGRTETGEHRRVIEHELEWATWIVDASQTRVMHLKTPGCKCTPDWEED